MEWRRKLEWHPRSLDWRIAALFMVGSSLFALGSFPLYAELVDPGVVGITFFAGSLFFTSAGYSQFLQAINAPEPESGTGRPAFRYFAWQPGRLVFWATAVQLVGTLFFNVNTFNAMQDGLSTQEMNRLVWAPDFFGSIAFLIASHLAWLLVCGRWWAVRRDDGDWWAAGLNYTGSIFFMLSAIGAFTLPTSGNMVNITLVNAGTFLGAVCFFVGAYLLLPAAHEPPNAREPG
jgi:hypothetical protein